MYNTEWKEAYIEGAQLEKADQITTQLHFNLVEPKEIEHGKDVSLFDRDEILDVYKFINPTSTAYLSRLKATLFKYTDYCKSVGYISADTVNPYDNFTVDDLVSCLNTDLIQNKILSRQSILNMCISIAPREAFAILCLFEGIEGKGCREIANIKESDIDFKNKVIHLETRDISVSDELLHFARLANELTYTYMYPSKQAIDLSPSPYIVKNTILAKGNKAAPVSWRNIANSVKKVLSMYNLDDYITSKNIRESGKLYYVQLRAQELELSFEETLKQEKELVKIEQRFDCKINGYLMRKTYKDHL